MESYFHCCRFVLSPGTKRKLLDCCFFFTSFLSMSLPSEGAVPSHPGGRFSTVQRKPLNCLQTLIQPLSGGPHLELTVFVKGRTVSKAVIVRMCIVFKAFLFPVLG